MLSEPPAGTTRSLVWMSARLFAPLIAALTLALGACGSGGGSEAATAVSPEATDESVLVGSLPLLDGTEQSLGDFKGDVVLVVNTASECGYTSQFEGLQALYEERRSDGLTILGFPADDVAGQEPRGDAALADFCEENFGVEFPMFAKSNVLGEEANLLFQRLTDVAGEPSWNFNKYLLDRKGRVVEHYTQGTGPEDPELLSRIEDLL